MMKSLLLALLFIAQTCAAQSLAWKAPIFFDDILLESGSPASFDAAYDPLPSQMLLSAAGSSGWIAAATLEAEDGNLPAVVKLSRVDGRTLWRWMWLNPGPDFAWSTGNRTVRATVDSAGQVFVTGWTHAADGVHSFLVKLDGATGAEQWRFSGAAHTRGYAVAADGNGNVFVGYVDRSAPNNDSNHVIEKRRADTGALIWSTTLPGGTDTFDDLRVVLDAGGNAIMAGGYALPDQAGARIAKLRASDGSIVWMHTALVSTNSFGGAAASLRVFASGDVLAEVSAEGLVYLNADGSKRWSRLPGDGFNFSDLAVGLQGQIYFAGAQYRTPEHTTYDAVFGRIDPATGAELWRSQPDGGSQSTEGLKVGIATNGSVLAVWALVLDYTPLRAGMLNPDTGHLDWTVTFGGIDPDISARGFGVTQDADGSIFVAASGDRRDNPLTSETWTLYKITGPFSDDIFANGWDG